MLNYHQKIADVISNINKVIIGKEEVVTLSLATLLARGHVLLEDVPGVGKTMLVRTLAKSLDLDFKRIQFTPDLLPSDVTGVSIYNPKVMEFEFRPGPILGNIILADEINRTSPKTQSALLEAMEEKSVSVDGHTIALNNPFFVMATQNPIEHEGTYPLPEAQLDRFLVKLNMGYPTYEEELELLDRNAKNHPLETVTAVMTKDELIQMQAEVDNIYIDETIQRYIVSLVTATRENPAVYLGASPRASIALMKVAKAFAFMRGRDFVLPDDVKYLAPFVLTHRLILTSESLYGGVTSEGLIKFILKETTIPLQREANR